jgi:hypothetical protein
MTTPTNPVDTVTVDPYAPIIVEGIVYDPRTVREDFERECG